MESAGVLELIAELAVAVLGFSGVVAALGGRSAGEWTLLDRIRFFSMVRITVSVLVLAVLPFPFHFAGCTDDQTWGWCSALGVVLMSHSFVATFLDGGLSKDTRQGTSRLAVAYSWTAAAISLGLFTMNAAGIGLERSFTPYLVATLLTFDTPIVLFMRLLDGAIGSGRAA